MKTYYHMENPKDKMTEEECNNLNNQLNEEQINLAEYVREIIDKKN